MEDRLTFSLVLMQSRAYSGDSGLEPGRAAPRSYAGTPPEGRNSAKVRGCTAGTETFAPRDVGSLRSAVSAFTALVCTFACAEMYRFC